MVLLDQDLNPQPLHRECKALTTGPGNPNYTGGFHDTGVCSINGITDDMGVTSAESSMIWVFHQRNQQ